MFIYPDHDEAEIVDFWSKVTKIPVCRFNKTINLIQRSGKFRTSTYGTLKIRYSHKEHFLRLQGIMEDVFGGVA